MIEHRRQLCFKVIVESVHVEYADRFGVQPKLQPCDGFEQLLHRAKAPWQSQDHVGTFHHHEFPLVHALHDDVLRDIAVEHLRRAQEVGDDTRYVYIMLHSGARKLAHESYATSAVNNSPRPISGVYRYLSCGCSVGGKRPVSGATVHKEVGHG